MLGVSHVTAPAGPTYTPASCMPVWYAGAPRHLAEHSGAHPAASEVRLHELQLVSTLFPTPPPVSAALPPSDSMSAWSDRVRPSAVKSRISRQTDRKSVGSGKSVSVCVDIGWRRFIKKKK